MRNHTTLARPDVIKEIASCVPDGHVVDLEHAEVFILVEIFKVLFHCYRLYLQLAYQDSMIQSVCGVSVVKDYHAKFNVMEISSAKNNEGEMLDH